MKKEPKKGSGLNLVFFLIFVALFCISSYKVGSQWLTERREKSAFDALIAQVNASSQAARSTNPPSAPEAPASQSPADEESPAGHAQAQEAGGQAEAPQGDDTWESTQTVTAAVPSEQGSGEAPVADAPLPGQTPVPQVLEAYAPLYAQNPDLFGWIQIEDTAVNYPVMYTPEDSEYYLHRAFNGEETFSGVPFMDAECFLDCGNYLVYGHHMKNGEMFAPIVQYAKESFWEEHPVILFNTLYETGVYEVIGAFYSRVFGERETDVFRYYAYTDLTDPELFDAYVQQVQEASIYDTGIKAEYGDQLLTLSTCEYGREDGRFVVVAKRKLP